MKLSELAHVFSGVLKTRLKSSVKQTNNQQFALLNYGCFDGDGILELKKCALVQTNALVNKTALIRKNDIIVKLFPPVSFMLIDAEYENLLCPSNIAIIRTMTTDPVVLIYLLEKCKLKINQMLQGVTVCLLNTRMLKEIPINTSDLNNKTIVCKARINHLINRQLRLLQMKQHYLRLKKKHNIVVKDK